MLWVILFIMLVVAFFGLLAWAGYKLLQSKVTLHHIESVEMIGDRAITAKTPEERERARVALTMLASVAASSTNPLLRNRRIAEHYLSKVDSVIFFGKTEGHMTEEEGRQWKDEVSEILYPLLRTGFPGRTKKDE